MNISSDSSILLKRIRRLSQALIVSGALNIVILSLFLYWVLRERPPTPYCVLKPASYEQQQIPLADHRGCAEVLVQLSTLSFPQLVSRLSNSQVIEDGYAERDLALACLRAFHHFDIQRALPKSDQPKQKRFFSWQPKAEVPPLTLVVYPDLKQHHFDALMQFAKTEKWPLTSEGLFLLLQDQHKKNEVNENLVETFILTPEFWTVELLFNRSGQQLAKQEIMDLLMEGNWILLQDFVEQQKQIQDSSDARRQRFLLDYLNASSPSAARLFLKMEKDFAVKKLNDEQVLSILRLMPKDLVESESYAKEMLASPRGVNVWQAASEWLYTKAGESVPDSWDHHKAVERFAVGRKSDAPTLKEAAMPALVTAVSSDASKTHPPAGEKLSKPLAADQKPKSTVKANKAPATKQAIVDRTHTVQEGDSLWKIARLYGVKIEEIKTLNGMKSDVLKPGVVLKIPRGKEKKA